jgi:hypothetical protein
MQARNILTLHMRDRYKAALDQFATGWWYSTGIGTVIPSMYRAHPACFDAGTNRSVCASVASAIASENSPDALRALAASVAATGFPQAANALLTKADRL